MWSTIFIPEEDGRTVGPPPQGGGAPQGPGTLGGLGGLMATRGNKRRRAGSSGHALSEAMEGMIKLAFFVAIVGMVLAVLGVGTEFWVELSPPKRFFSNEVKDTKTTINTWKKTHETVFTLMKLLAMSIKLQYFIDEPRVVILGLDGYDTCLTAHYGLWKGCTKSLWLADIPPDRLSCGPAELRGESNCTYFKFFTTGENAVMFQKTTQKNLNVAAAMLALFSLFLMVMGSICITMALSKEILFFLKPASFCFSLSGVLVLVSLLVFHQSVQALLASDPSVPLHHHMSWSVTCLGCAGAVLLAGGLLFLMLALPYSAWQRCLPRRGGGN
ncbi:Voltage-dependent calcium channel gamma-6 subunit [Merluccius polli]|uniref:Voltage-dependent calcium channel gamma-6 subunit n=1 Tax=Merluccius polli TaxID=89951 RepID=A0AA47M9D4_MERPO|nr:Voltage-dependent calcium channel gamma-6 subunit [Merluccius polli]